MIVLTRPLVLIDLETTGKSATLDRIVQIAALRVSPDGHEVFRKDLVNPERPIPPAVQAVHHITDEMVQDAPTWGALAPTWAKAIEGCDLAGFRVKFDRDFLHEGFLREGVPSPINEQTKIIDAARLWQVLKPRTLADAVQEFLGRPMKAGAHDAGVDILETWEVLKAQCASPALQTAEGLPPTPATLHEMSWPWPEGALDPDGKIVWSDGAPRWTFGKYQGWDIRLSRPDYLEWILGKDFSPDVKAICRKVRAGEAIEAPTR